MQHPPIKAAIFDVDGTLVPYGSANASPATCRAIAQLQAAGIQVIIASGRALYSIHAVTNGIQADYYLSANGGWLADRNGKTLSAEEFSQEEMYALVDFFEDYDLPITFIFSDGYYVYVEYERYLEHYLKATPVSSYIYNGEDQTRHLQSMPYAATGAITPAQREEFQAKFGHLGLRFVPFHPNHCDILHGATNKAQGLGSLLDTLGISWAEVAAFGDGENDVEMLNAAGLAIVMENGCLQAKAIADVIAPDAAQDGVAAAIQMHILNK